MSIQILIIDDDDLVRGTLAENLGEVGFLVETASDGVAALAKLASGLRPDVVVTDIIMPGKEGLETILELRRTYPDMKIVAISGGGRHRGGDFLEMATKLGANAVLPKPIDLEMLENTVRDLCVQGAAG